MSTVKRNTVANFIGGIWSALMALAFVPVYIGYLGIEAYGLIGIFVMLAQVLALLDMGVTPTLNREMARFAAGAHTTQSIRNLLRSLEALSFALAVLIGLGVWGVSGYLANDWLQVNELSVDVVAQAISVMGWVIALRFVEGIYRGSLFGLQRQVWYNGANIVLETMRYAGAIAILAWVSPTLRAFFLWHALVSVLAVAVFGASVHGTLPHPASPPRVSREAIAGVWRFAGGMMGITFLVLLLTQVDKIILSRLLTLEAFGYYALAAAVAGVIRRVIGPFLQAVYPRLVELVTREDEAGLVFVYHQGSQLVTVLAAPAGILLSVFSGGVLFMWSGDVSLAQNTAPILSVLALGTLLNGLMWMPYHLQLAYGWTRLSLTANTLAVAVLVPAILWVAPRYGAVGAAWMWVLLNAGYALIGIHFMHRRLIPGEKWRWYFADVLLPAGGALTVILLAQTFQPTAYQDRSQWFLFLLVSGGLALATATALASHARAQVLKLRVFSADSR